MIVFFLLPTEKVVITAAAMAVGQREVEMEAERSMWRDIETVFLGHDLQITELVQ